MYELINVAYHHEHRLLICRPRGFFYLDFALQLLNFLLALEEVSNPFNRLLDLALVTGIPLSSQKIQEYAEGRRQATAHRAPFRTAVIAPSPEAEAAARLYAMLVKGSKIEVGIFSNAALAAQWLDLPEDVLRSPAFAGRQN
jgi:hypothetical protein